MKPRKKAHIYKCLLSLVFMLAFAGAASSDSLTYTMTGDCGVSVPVNGVSANSFTWALSNTSAATVAGSTLDGFGFDPLSGVFNGTTPEPYSSNGRFSGSLLLSNAFTVNGSQNVTVQFADIAAMGFDWGNFDFAVLLQNSQVAAVMALVSQMSPAGTEDQNYLGTKFEPLTTGAQMAITMSEGYPQDFELGSTVFGGPDGNRNCDNNPCLDQITSTYAPGAGTYQLLFGSFTNGNNFPDAIAVESVQVPESGTLEYLALGLLAIPLIFGRKKAGIQ
jgi:hypothetical protein